MTHMLIAFAVTIPCLIFGIPAHGATMTCVPKNPSEAWVKKIAIDISSRKVLLEVEAFRTQSSSVITQLEAIMEKSDETQFGERIYAFNTYPRPGVEVTSLYKLFKGTSDWRLIEAGIVYVGSKPTLRAIDSGKAYDCKKS